MSDVSDAFQPGVESSVAADDAGAQPDLHGADAPQPDPAAEVEMGAAEVEADIDSAVLAKERDEYLDALRRLQADFDNYKKRMVRQQTEHLELAPQAPVKV